MIIKIQDFKTGAPAFSGINYQHSLTPQPIQPLNIQRGQYTEDSIQQCYKTFNILKILYFFYI